MAVTKQSSGAKAVAPTKVNPSVAPVSQDVPAHQVDNLEQATAIEASGALIEPTIIDRIDTSHPAVDNEPRKGVSPESNQIDFNDPTLTLTEQVAQNLVAENLKASEKDAE